MTWIVVILFRVLSWRKKIPLEGTNFLHLPPSRQFSCLRNSSSSGIEHQSTFRFEVQNAGSTCIIYIYVSYVSYIYICVYEDLSQERETMNLILILVVTKGNSFPFSSWRWKVQHQLHVNLALVFFKIFQPLDNCFPTWFQLCERGSCESKRGEKNEWQWGTKRIFFKKESDLKCRLGVTNREALSSAQRDWEDFMMQRKMTFCCQHSKMIMIIIPRLWLWYPDYDYDI